MSSSIFEAVVRRGPYQPEEIFRLSAGSPQAATQALRFQLGPDVIIEMRAEPLSDSEAQQAGLTTAKFTVG